MNGLKRALRYFIRQAELYVMFIFAGSIVMAFYQQFLRGGSMSFSDTIRYIPVTMVCVTFLVLFVCGTSDGQIWYSMLISFGCRRKNVFLGSITMYLLIITESLILYELSSRVILHRAEYGSLPLLAALYLAMGGIAQFIGVAVVKLGKIAYVMIFMMIIICSVAAGVLVVISSGGTLIETWYCLIEDISRPIWQCGALLIGAAVWAVANAATYCFLSSFEVRA